MEIKSGAYGAREYCSQTRAEQYLKTDGFALVAEKEEEIVGTMLVTYDEGEIPADEVFPVEVSRIRDSFRQIAYYSNFAIKAGMWYSGIRRSIGIALIREAIVRARADGIKAAIIIINPRHIKFYKALGFEKVAARDNMPGLGGDVGSRKIPAVLMVATRETFCGFDDQ